MLRQRQSISASAGFMCIAYFSGSAAYHALLTQQIAIFASEGIPPSEAVWIAAFAGGVVFGWRLASGWLCDVVGVRRVMTLVGFAVALTTVSLLLVVSGRLVEGTAIYPFAFGIGFGGQQVLLAVIVRGLARPADFAENLALGRLASGIGMAAGPVLGGLAFDLTTSSLIVVLLVAALATIHVLVLAQLDAFAFGKRLKGPSEGSQPSSLSSARAWRK